MGDRRIARPVLTHTVQQRNTFTYIHAFSGIRTCDPSFKRSKTTLDRTGTMVGPLIWKSFIRCDLVH